MVKRMLAAVLWVWLVFSFVGVPAAQGQSQDQAAAARSSAGCGPAGVEFEVKTDKKRHPAPQPEAGKALVYVFQHERDKPDTYTIGAVTVRVGLDGNWVGANHGSSYFFFPVEAGEHRVCSQVQSIFKRYSKLASAISLKAEPGKAYYFRIFLDTAAPNVKLEAIDEAEAELLIGSSALSSSHPKVASNEKKKGDPAAGPVSF
jgi:hypothetical protein